MKKALTLIVVFLISAGFAADTDQFNIVVTCEFLHFELVQSGDHGTDYETWNLGVVSPGDAATTMTSDDHIYINNYCNIPVDFSAYVTNSLPSCTYGSPTPWIAGSSAASDTYVFDLGQNIAGPWTNITATSSAGDGFATSIAAGTGFDLFGRFQPPSDVSDGCQHTITVNLLITAS